MYPIPYDCIALLSRSGIHSLDGGGGLMSESQATRAQNVESITSSEAAKADLDEKTESTKQQETSQEAELSGIKQYIAQLHANCDFLIENYDLRKAARANEIESLKNAKSVLSGANFA